MSWRMAGVLLMTAGSAFAAPGDTTLLDDFRDASRWQASASDQVSSTLRRDAGGALCLDYDFKGVSGYAVARRTLDLALPDNYEFRLRLSGQGPSNHFQFKLTDASGDNVWWLQQPDVRHPPQPRDLRIRQRQIQFAWGPTADKRLRRPQALELVMASGSGGGRGSVCFERFTLVERAPVPAQWPQPRVAAAGQGVDIDLGLTREFSGMQLNWPAAGPRLRDYVVEADDGSGQWAELARVRRAAGPVDALFLPDAEARRLRLRPLDAGNTARGPLALPELTLVDASAWRSADDATAARARAMPRGAFPRAYLGEQNYWTLFGVDRGARSSALLSEDGAIEPAPGQPSIEPFVMLEEGRGKKLSTRLVSWADVAITHHLPDGYLPQPRVRWTHPAFTLDIDAGASGDAQQAHGLARYTLRAAGTSDPKGRARLKATLLLVTRPWQVNPPQQFLNRPGGAAAIRTLQWQDGALFVNNGGPQVQALPAPAQVLGGGGADWPAAMALVDVNKGPARGDKGLAPLDETPWAAPDGRGEGALIYPLTLAPGAEARVALAWPMVGAFEPPHSVAEVDAAFDASAQAWRARLNRVGLQLPALAQRVHDTLRSALAQILLSRDGPALQPGTRSYARAWVRDGAMMVAGLLRLGEVQAAEEFVDWYQTKLFDNGKVPCCVDARGADPVPENDSHGQFIYAVAELWRFTKDRAALQRRWPTVERATRYMETLRQSERTAANRAPGREAFFGLMPASISHEGYSEKPMHSYWDDFWALRGYKDAVLLADALGRGREAAQFTAWRDEFAVELSASIRTAVTTRDIAFVPGAAELGDFDPTSTTVALNPAQAQGLLPPGLLQATFERYWHESQQRRRGDRDWKDYTPYELRSVGALVRLGRPARALAMLDFFFADQRPAGWNQWAEVVMKGYREPKFLGDMPHAWVASDAIRSLLDLFVHDEGEALVLGAGLPEAWLAGPGVAVQRLPTPGGPLSYRMKRVAGGLQVDIDAGLQPPPGGFKVRWHGREQRIERLPASITLED